MLKRPRDISSTVLSMSYSKANISSLFYQQNWLFYSLLQIDFVVILNIFFSSVSQKFIKMILCKGRSSKKGED